ncbi:MAG: PQQ-dependent dehydrogenase, methanol/ethanol family, partial [Kiloniellales bacterium]|nr:PQQ-dependent dehydrogenase, methanol/ethanol family [Kiloniellales bacterium]
MRLRLATAVSALALAVSAPAFADVAWEDIARDAETTENVLMYGFGPKAQRYSPLDQIDVENVDRLVAKWSFSFGDERQRGQETQAIIHDGVIYVTASYSRMFALDARTGKRLWQFSARLPEGIRPCC